MDNLEFNGVWTALVTPLYRGEVDFKSLKNIIRHQLDNGVDGFVVSGTTGESPTLTREEKQKIFKYVRSEVASHVPLMFGSGSNSTQETIELSKAAKKWGAKSLLIVVPYYNKPPQRGLVAHFGSVAAAVKLPVMLYNVPSRTVVGLTLESIQTLSKVKNIIGIKEATGDLEFGVKILRSSKLGFSVMSGDDGTCVDLAFEGGSGVISVLSHIVPDKLKIFIEDARNKKASAPRDFKKYLKLTNMLFKEANPIPVKAALKTMGLIKSDEVRLPLSPIDPKLNKELKAEMKYLGICE